MFCEKLHQVPNTRGQHWHCFSPAVVLESQSLKENMVCVSILSTIDKIKDMQQANGGWWRHSSEIITFFENPFPVTSCRYKIAELRTHLYVVHSVYSLCVVWNWMQQQLIAFVVV